MLYSGERSEGEHDNIDRGH